MADRNDLVKLIGKTISVTRASNNISTSDVTLVDVGEQSIFLRMADQNLGSISLDNIKSVMYDQPTTIEGPFAQVDPLSAGPSTPAAPNASDSTAGDQDPPRPAPPVLVDG